MATSVPRLDYHFWNLVKAKVYEDRFDDPFANEDELKKKIKKVWPECARNAKEIRKALKQFTQGLNAVHEMNGECIKMHFG